MISSTEIAGEGVEDSDCASKTFTSRGTAVQPYAVIAGLVVGEEDILVVLESVDDGKILYGPCGMFGESVSRNRRLKMVKPRVQNYDEVLRLSIFLVFSPD